MSPDRLKAVIYVPDLPDAAMWRARALRYIDDRGYILVAVVEGGADDTWLEMARMGAAGELDVVVVGDRSHLDPDRIPRVEFLTEVPVPRQRRATRNVRRPYRAP